MYKNMLKGFVNLKINRLSYHEKNCFLPFLTTSETHKRYIETSLKKII